jgi:hypothetical protein
VVEALQVLTSNQDLMCKYYKLLLRYRVGPACDSILGTSPKNQLRVFLSKYDLLSEGCGVRLDADVGMYLKMYHLARAEYFPLEAGYAVSYPKGRVMNINDQAALTAANEIKKEHQNRLRMIRPLIVVLSAILNYM